MAKQFQAKTYTQTSAATTNACGEGVKFLFRAPFKTFLAMLLLGILLAMPMGTWLFYKNIQAISHSWENSPKIILYLSMGTTEQQALALQDQLKQRTDIAKAVYVSPLQGVKELVQQLGLGDLLAKLSFNPLPAVIEVQPASSLSSVLAVSKLADQLKLLPLVASLQLNMDVVKHQYASLALWQKIISLVIGLVVLALLSAIIYIMQLLALLQPAKFSFWCSGLFLGLLSGVTAIVIVAVSFAWLALPFFNLFGKPLVNIDVNAMSQLLGIGGLLGLIGAWFARPK